MTELALPLPLPMPAPSSEPEEVPDIIGQLLRAQAEPSAVEVFADWHDRASDHRLEPTYRRLLPSGPPGEGEQYAFAVDLDACTACKACVSACHSLNGLDHGEMWRSVGTISGGSVAEPYRQTVTTACHHCLEPGCMYGCPVNAYEKDPVTGIVRHLDDQCIGCRYCMLSCPYDVPRFNASRGIVRKCDMCADRLAEGEAPACVQGCPNDAISITVVSASSVIDDLTSGNIIPGAPDPKITLPTTQYRTQKLQPKNTGPVDLSELAPREAHPPLTLMLTLSQLSVGALAVDTWLPLEGGGLNLFATLIGLLALGASTLHLGRPQWAFRALLGLRRSWLSREIFAFGAFAGLAVASVIVSELQLDARLGAALRHGAVGMGLFGILTSAMIYKSTGRPTWSGLDTPLKFFATALLLGCATQLWIGALCGTKVHDAVSQLLLAAVVLKLALEVGVLHALFDRVESPRRSSARLLVGPLRPWFLGRLVPGILGGLAAPLLVVVDVLEPSALLTSLVILALTVAELLSAHLFFVAAAARKMPGDI